MVKYTDNISSTNKNGELFNLILLPEYLIFVSRNEETSLHNSSDPFSPDYLFFIIAVPVVRLCRAVVPMAVPNVRSLILAIQRKIVEKRAVRQLSISPI